ncbi:MAG: hypothetical protein A3H42_04545 [Deltaproteobacteria bacterium RIFCSPLOWO2_02_FULL_46_8]|nr:MAG: hypothetical protein A3H42_04545 [Deltaproteobacteria bacterium RIFCSPLOWO2_02_FULL_46_8]
MYDVHFFKNSEALKKKIISSGPRPNRDEIYKQFESLRSQRPYVFNIETTNVCNMACHMCPRPTLMTRKLKHMEMELFEKIIHQITPHGEESLKDFWNYIVDEYGVHSNDRNENAFYFYTVSRCVTLHGYGEPPLDPFLIERIKLCRAHNIPTYFSCVPANINVGKFVEMMKAGAGVIKFAMDALDDENSRKIRGDKNNFNEAYEKILQLLQAKAEDPSIKTTIVLTMIALSESDEAKKTHRDFLEIWRDKDVFAYVKSQDNRWHHEEDLDLVNKSHYETQYCEYPWTSTSIMVDGSVVPCTQDYNNEMVFGNANHQSLEEIWNNKAYDDFRKWHILGNFPSGHKCAERCDQKLLCDRASGLNQKNVKQLIA